MKKLLLVALFFMISITTCLASNYSSLQNYLIDKSYISKNIEEVTNVDNILTYYNNFENTRTSEVLDILYKQLIKNPDQPILQLIYSKYLLKDENFEDVNKIIKKIKTTYPELSPYIYYYELICNLEFLLNDEKCESYDLNKGVNDLINAIEVKAKNAGKIDGVLINQYGNCMKYIVAWKLKCLYFMAMRRNLDIQTVEQIYNLMNYTYKSITLLGITDKYMNIVVPTPKTQRLMDGEGLYKQNTNGNKYYKFVTLCTQELNEYKKSAELEKAIDPTKFYGIGIAYQLNDGKFEITKVIPLSPAYHAQLMLGDIIVAVDGRKTDGMNSSEIANLIRGPENSTVEISILRDGKEITKKIQRKEINIGP